MRTREPKSADEFVSYLEECDRAVRSDPSTGLELAQKASVYLERLGVSEYLGRNLQMRRIGVLGDALAATGGRLLAAEVYDEARQILGSPAERASLAIRLARFYAEHERWDEALSEASMAVKRFRQHRPRYETDLRSLSGALVARGNIFFLAHIGGVDIPSIVPVIKGAEVDYRAALGCASARTEFCVIAAVTNLAHLSLRCWWASNDRVIHPLQLANEMRKVCSYLTKKGIRHGSPAHAKARALYGLASVEAYHGLNRSNEARLEGAFRDLLLQNAIEDAAVLALDLGYCYLREGRWEDLLTTTVTVLHHPAAKLLTPRWRQALELWKVAIEKSEVSCAIKETFTAIRGFAPGWAEAKDVPLPKSRYGDRADTLGF